MGEGCPGRVEGGARSELSFTHKVIEVSQMFSSKDNV